MNYRYHEFFAGGGMVTAALGAAHWECVFANDFDYKKVDAYRANWTRKGADRMLPGDIRKVRPSDIPTADLSWASFPCQDLSLAGAGAGLSGDRSGTFFPFWEKIEALLSAGRGPYVVTLENVIGTVTSHQGRDFAVLVSTLAAAGFKVGGVVVDAVRFVPQSRPRLFVVATRGIIPPECMQRQPDPKIHPKRLVLAVQALPREVADHWIWWRLPEPPVRNLSLCDLLQDDDEIWDSSEATDALLRMMSEKQAAELQAIRRRGARTFGTVYKRTRRDAGGKKIQRAEARFDGVAGCLRTPAGGSSRQILLEVHGTKTRSRLLTARETARLMGLPDSYCLPSGFNQALHLTGDGVAVPVVRYLAESLLRPLIVSARASVAEEAA